MSLLSDRSLRSRLERRDALRITIEPLAPDAVQPCSIDVHLGPHLLVYTGVSLDTDHDDASRWLPVPLVELDPDGRDRGWTLRPDKFYLGTLLEWVRIPHDVAGEIRGVSTRARQGVVLHQQAGHLDPGYAGHPTLEITVVACARTVVRPGLRIGQLTFSLLDRPAEQGYDGRYMHDWSPQPARLDRKLHTQS